MLHEKADDHSTRRVPSAAAVVGQMAGTRAVEGFLGSLVATFPLPVQCSRTVSHLLSLQCRIDCQHA